MTVMNWHPVKLIRHRLGWSQAKLAERAGVSRTNITAIEARQSVPSVAIALAIAQALDCTVEELFGQADPQGKVSWAWPPPSPQSSLWYARVGQAIVKYPASTQPMLPLLPDPASPDERAEETLVIACCDPAIGFLASQFAEVTGMRLITLHRSSRDALEMLRDGAVHLAGLHWSNTSAPDENRRAATDRLNAPFTMVRLARWQFGVAVASPIKDRSITALRRSRLRWIGREAGSAARRSLDQILEGRAPPKLIAPSHRAVAAMIQCGAADAGACVELVSAESGLRFIPVHAEMLDLCYFSELAGDRRLRALLRVIRSAKYRRLMGDVPGYSLRDSGEVIHE